MSLHIYGQDFATVGGDEARGLKSFFESFDEKSVVKRSLSSDAACEMLVLPQLRGLLSDDQRAQWGFPPESIRLIEGLIADLESGRLTA
jgi:hypothetical protein